MADGVRVSGLGFAAPLVPANDLLYVVQPAQSPKSRKITVQNLLAGPTAEAHKASYYIYTVDTGSGTALGLSMEPDRNMSVRFSGSAAFTTVQVPDGEYDGQIVAITNDRSTSLTVQAVTPSTLHKTIVLGNGESCTLTWEGSGSWRADSASPALAAEATARSNFDAQFATAISTANGCAAIGAAGGGNDIVDNPNSQFRMARLGPKAWNVQVLSQFGSGTPIVGGTTMEWFFNVPEADSAGPLKDLYDTLLPLGYVPFGNRSWLIEAAGMLTWSLSIKAGLGPLSAKGFFIYADGYGWSNSTTAAFVISQLSLRASGMVILP